MTNSKQLHDEAGRIFRKSQDKINEADKASARAQVYEKAGNIARSKMEAQFANKYYEEALRLERTATKLDSEAAELEQEALLLENQEFKLKQTFTEQILKLEHRQKILRGDI